ncbi:hypothetical protein BDR07DRAFT_873145 [Suillus spraguei]|nr:hypothetical protein BDR07DRAFT_873145 [Suillus spraguei]
MPRSSEGRYIRLDGKYSILPSYLFPDPHALSTVICGQNIGVPSYRIPAGIYVSINVDSERRWTTATKVLSSEKSVVWGSTVTLSCASPAVSIEIRASYEVDQMLAVESSSGKFKRRGMNYSTMVMSHSIYPSHPFGMSTLPSH